jgi:hypothetical protein
MNSSVIVYGSQYGSAERYARHLSKITGIPCMNFKETKGLRKYGKVVFLGALYAGKVLGLKNVVNDIADNQELIVVTVGMVGPNDPQNIHYIRERLKNVIPSHLYDEQKIFHLQGAIDYSRMRIKHRLMMFFVNRRLSKLPKEYLSVGSKTIVETYGKTIDNVDFQTLEPLINCL